jgi:hypothetical protein
MLYQAKIESLCDERPTEAVKDKTQNKKNDPDGAKKNGDTHKQAGHKHLLARRRRIRVVLTCTKR